MRSRPFVSRVLVLALVTTLFAAVGCGGGSSSPAVNTGAVSDSSTGAVSATEQNNLVTVLNQERSKHGFSPLDIDATLQAIATQYSGEMAATNSTTYVFAINGSDMATRVRNAGISYSMLGHYGAIDFTTGASVVNAFVTAGSTLVTESNYRRIGVGVAKSAGHNYWTIVVIN